MGDGLSMHRIIVATVAQRLKGLNKIVTIVDEEVDSFSVQTTPGTKLNDT